MIANQDIKPEKQAYYIGAQILDAMATLGPDGVAPYQLFQEVSDRILINPQSFGLGLTWLYITGAVELERGKVRRCS